jgi:hypothetical protein
MKSAWYGLATRTRRVQLRKPPLAYLMAELNGKGDFAHEWKNLSEWDKATLRRWAEEEQDALGL